MNRSEYNRQAMTKAHQLLAELDGEGEKWDQDLDDAVDMVGEAAADYDSAENVDERIDAVVAIYNAHYAGGEHQMPPRTTEDQPATSPTHPRDIYNRVILEEALSCQEENGEYGDIEMDAQVDRVKRLQQGAYVGVMDLAVDHLRRMLTTSYLDDEDLPTAFDRSDELVEITVRLSAPQAQALRRAARATTETTPDRDEFAAFTAIIDAIRQRA